MLKRFSLALAALAMTTGAAVAAPTPLDSAIQAAAEHGFAGVVLVTDRKGVTYSRAIGLADRARDRPHTVDEVWPWASVTKQVTAYLVMQQVDRGSMALDTPIARYVPDFKGPTASTVTVRQLMQHTSGLPNPDDTPPGVGSVPDFYLRTGVKVANGEAARGYCAGPVKAASPASFSYNNCDYLVLGAALERVAGKSYAQLVAAELPKGGAPAPRPAPDRVANGLGELRGYQQDGKLAPASNLATFGAAGDLVGRPQDLAAFDRLLMDGEGLSPAAQAAMWSGNPKLGYAALGAWVFPAPLAGCKGAVRLVERRGEIEGVAVRNLIAPDLGLALVVFTNVGDTDFGEIWMGKGLTYTLASAAFCPSKSG